MQSTTPGGRTWAYVYFVAALVASIAAFVGLGRLQISPLAALGRTALPLGLLVFSISLLVRPKSMRVANILLVLTFLLYAVYLALLFGSRR